jgi:hypothetical protein
VEQEKDDPADFMKVTQQSKLEAAPESEQDKKFDVLWNGAKWGLLAGFAIAQFIISRHSPFGFYIGGDVGVLLFSWMGGGAAAGALFAWLCAKLPRDGERR